MSFRFRQAALDGRFVASLGFGLRLDGGSGRIVGDLGGGFVLQALLFGSGQVGGIFFGLRDLAESEREAVQPSPWRRPLRRWRGT